MTERLVADETDHGTAGKSESEVSVTKVSIELITQLLRSFGEHQIEAEGISKDVTDVALEERPHKAPSGDGLLGDHRGEVKFVLENQAGGFQGTGGGIVVQKVGRGVSNTTGHGNGGELKTSEGRFGKILGQIVEDAVVRKTPMNKSKGTGNDYLREDSDKSLDFGGVGKPEGNALKPSHIPSESSGSLAFSCAEGKSCKLIPGLESDPVVLIFDNVVANETFGIGGAKSSNGLNISAKTVVNFGGDKTISDGDVNAGWVGQKSAFGNPKADFSFSHDRGATGDQEKMIGTD